MLFILRRFFLLVSVLGCLGSVAWAGHYADPSGFSFDYPDDWVPVNGATLRQDLIEKMPSELKEWFSKNQFDFNRMAVMVVRTGGSESFRENFNVVTTDQVLPVDEASIKKITGSLEQEYAKIGMKPGTLRVHGQTIGSRKAMMTQYQLQMPGVSEPMRQKQAFFPSKTKTYIVTFAARADSFDQYEPVFDRVLATFDVPAPVAQGFNWSQVIMSGVIAAVAGGVASWVVVKKKKNAPKTSVQE